MVEEAQGTAMAMLYGVTALGVLLQQVVCTPVLSRMVNKLETCIV
jgi:hypothetical protein